MTRDSSLSKSHSEQNESNLEPSKLPMEQEKTSLHRFGKGKSSFSYEVCAGHLHLKKEDKANASMFYIFYKKTNVKKGEKRPITFVFNGGPGSSSVWLHLGAFGPQRVLMNSEGLSLPPPSSLTDNPHSLLPSTDLVFIDPIGTGFSRACDKETEKEFFGVKEDIDSLSKFICLFLSRNHRWSSPKFIAGESYGGTRAAALTHHLESRMGVPINGILLVSPALVYDHFVFGNHSTQLAYACFLPSYAATAWYHQRLKNSPRSLSKVLKEVEQFTLHHYLPYLLLGNRVKKAEQKEITQTLSRYTGLSEKYIELCHQRIPAQRFMKELLRENYETVGRFDSRMKGKDRDAAGECFEFDPSHAFVSGSYTTCCNDYLRRQLGYETDLEYRIVNWEIIKNWKWSTETEMLKKIDFTDELRQTLVYNPHLRVFVINGYYDLATPYFASDYTLQHIGLEPSLTQRIQSSYYPAGHMMYIHEPSLKKMGQEVTQFIKTCLKPSL